MTAEHVVLPDDEARHTPDGEDLWNESYYCDFVRDDGSMGGWLRLGLYPNRQVAWWTTWIVWPDRPGVCSADYAPRCRRATAWSLIRRTGADGPRARSR